MAHYIVNKDAQSVSGDHEVHNVDVANKCLPDPANRLDLGDHANCQSAVQEAKQTYSDSNGCAFCAPQCHTT
jgi:hypothetical protein